MGHKAVIVFTSKDVDTLLAHGGSSCWKMRREAAATCEYVVCSWNADRRKRKGQPGDPLHRTAFLIGHVSSLAACQRPEGCTLGVMFLFSEYALLSLENVRPQRGPFEYVDDVESALGIRLDSLEWRRAPAPTTPIAIATR